MDRILTFVVPLRSPAASRNWQNVVARLHETVRSIESACSGSADVGAVIVANRDAEIGELPDCVDVVRVDLAPPAVSVFQGESEDNERRNAVGWDKGYKVASGINYAMHLGSKYIMSVDADDLIASDLVDLVHSATDSYGWYIDKGWLLPVGSRWGLVVGDFHNWCGTYAIVRTDLLPLESDVESVDPDVIRKIFGSHRYLIPFLKEKGTPLTPVDYRAAVYRIGHSEGNFGRKGIFSDILLPRKIFTDPKDFFKWLKRLRYFDESQSRRFSGSTVVPQNNSDGASNQSGQHH